MGRVAEEHAPPGVQMAPAIATTTIVTQEKIASEKFGEVFSTAFHSGVFFKKNPFEG